MEEKNDSNKLSKFISLIEKKYRVSYSSENFSRAVFYHLKGGAISQGEMYRAVYEYLSVNQNETRVTNVREMKAGNVYYFSYSPKSKKLDYYDMTPCIIYLGETRDSSGFYGLNLNYLHPVLRYELVSRLPYYRNRSTYESLVKKQKMGFKKDKAIKVDIVFSYLQAKALFNKEYRQIIKRYSNDRVGNNPNLFGIEIAKLVTMFDVHSFNKKNPYPLWKRVMGSITKNRGI